MSTSAEIQQQIAAAEQSYQTTFGQDLAATGVAGMANIGLPILEFGAMSLGIAGGLDPFQAMFKMGAAGMHGGAAAGSGVGSALLGGRIGAGIGGVIGGGVGAIAGALPAMALMSGISMGIEATGGAMVQGAAEQIAAERFMGTMGELAGGFGSQSVLGAQFSSDMGQYTMDVARPFFQSIGQETGLGTQGAMDFAGGMAGAGMLGSFESPDELLSGFREKLNKIQQISKQLDMGLGEATQVMATLNQAGIDDPEAGIRAGNISLLTGTSLSSTMSSGVAGAQIASQLGMDPSMGFNMGLSSMSSTRILGQMGMLDQSIVRASGGSERFAGIMTEQIMGMPTSERGMELMARMVDESGTRFDLERMNEVASGGRPSRRRVDPYALPELQEEFLERMPAIVMGQISRINERYDDPVRRHQAQYEMFSQMGIEDPRMQQAFLQQMQNRPVTDILEGAQAIRGDEDTANRVREQSRGVFEEIFRSLGDAVEENISRPAREFGARMSQTFQQAGDAVTQALSGSRGVGIETGAPAVGHIASMGRGVLLGGTDPTTGRFRSRDLSTTQSEVSDVVATMGSSIFQQPARGALEGGMGSRLDPNLQAVRDMAENIQGFDLARINPDTGNLEATMPGIGFAAPGQAIPEGAVELPLGLFNDDVRDRMIYAYGSDRLGGGGPGGFLRRMVVANETEGSGGFVRGRQSRRAYAENAETVTDIWNLSQGVVTIDGQSVAPEMGRVQLAQQRMARPGAQAFIEEYGDVALQALMDPTLPAQLGFEDEGISPERRTTSFIAEFSRNLYGVGREQTGFLESGSRAASAVREDQGTRFSSMLARAVGGEEGRRMEAEYLGALGGPTRSMSVQELANLGELGGLGVTTGSQQQTETQILQRALAVNLNRAAGGGVTDLSAQRMVTGASGRRALFALSGIGEARAAQGMGGVSGGYLERGSFDAWLEPGQLEPEQEVSARGRLVREHLSTVIESGNGLMDPQGAALGLWNVFGMDPTEAGSSESRQILAAAVATLNPQTDAALINDIGRVGAAFATLAINPGTGEVARTPEEFESSTNNMITQGIQETGARRSGIIREMTSGRGGFGGQIRRGVEMLETQRVEQAASRAFSERTLGMRAELADIIAPNLSRGAETAINQLMEGTTDPITGATRRMSRREATESYLRSQGGNTEGMLAEGVDTSVVNLFQALQGEGTRDPSQMGQPAIEAVVTQREREMRDAGATEDAIRAEVRQLRSDIKGGNVELSLQGALYARGAEMAAGGLTTEETAALGVLVPNVQAGLSALEGGIQSRSESDVRSALESLYGEQNLEGMAQNLDQGNVDQMIQNLITEGQSGNQRSTFQNLVGQAVAAGVLDPRAAERLEDMSRRQNDSDALQEIRGHLSNVIKDGRIRVFTLADE